MISVGVIGYSDPKFDKNIAKALMAIALDVVEANHEDDAYELVSGLTDMGIPAIAYEMAKKRGWKTVGIACSKAHDNPCFDVDIEIIEGKEWGDESAVFLDNIDVLIRIGGGKQSIAETKKAKDRDIPVYEYDLPEKK